MEKILSFREMRVYKNARAAAMQIFELTKQFPHEEKYSLVDQVRRSSRFVCVNLAEAWRKRCYRAAFLAKINDAEGEASETQSWIEIAHLCHYLDESTAKFIDQTYDLISGQLVRIKETVDHWLIPTPK